MQRLGLAAGSVIQGAAGFAGDIQPLADTLDVAGIKISSLNCKALYLLSSPHNIDQWSNECSLAVRI